MLDLKEILIENLDNVDIEFFEGENETDFEIDGITFNVTYLLEKSDGIIYDDDR